MTERERLIELIIKSVNGCARNWAEVIADYLLENGVVVLPCNCDKCEHLEVLNKKPIYAKCLKTNMQFELWKEDTRNHYCAFAKLKERENK